MTEVNSVVPSSIIDWFSQNSVLSKPWLIVGKGPSFCKFNTIDKGLFNICGLNHVVREIHVDVVHIIDIDVVSECAEAIDRNAHNLIIPIYPNESNRHGKKIISDYFSEIPILEKLYLEKRLYCYHLVSDPLLLDRNWLKKPEAKPVSLVPGFPGLPNIEATYFSVEGAVNVLAKAGVREIRTVGVDGGTNYADNYSDLRQTTLLNNGLSSFDRQFRGIAKAIRRDCLLYGPYGEELPLKLYLGVSGGVELFAKVLEFSLKKFTSVSLDIEVLDISTVSQSHFFSGLMQKLDSRNLENALYIDADYLILEDIWHIYKKLNDIDTGCVFINDGKGRDYSRPALIKFGRYDQDDSSYFPQGEIKRLEMATFLSGVNNSRRAVGSFHWLNFQMQKAFKLWIRLLVEGMNEGAIDKKFAQKEIAIHSVFKRIAKYLK